VTTLDTRRNGAAVAAQTGIEPQPMDDLAPAAGPSGHMQANSRRRGWPAIKPRLSREAGRPTTSSARYTLFAEVAVLLGG